MTLIIAPADGYDSLISVADADAYVSDMGLSGWPEDESEKERLLRRATQYILAAYAPSSKYLDPVHKNIKASTVEAAVRAQVLWSDVPASAVVEKTIGPLTTKYAEPTNRGQIRIGVIDALMQCFAPKASGSVRLLSRL